MKKTIGIYGVSGQSGKAFLSDLIAQQVPVYGYARPTEHGRGEIEAIRAQGGLVVERPTNNIEETYQFLPVAASDVGHDLEALVERSDIIVFSHPSVYHEDTARLLADLLKRKGRPTPLVLSPSRTLGTPYLWEILGDQYPIISFQTCPYACKTFRPGAVYIKRRKRAWIASVEGETGAWAVWALKRVFPQIVFSGMPATTSLGNIGAVFHPTAFLLNQDAIQRAAAEGRTFSFYMEGIAHNPVVGPVVEEVDQIRLRIARAVGCSVFGLREDPREQEWATLMSRVAMLEGAGVGDLRRFRSLRAQCLQPIHEAVVSAQHWLAYTYGVQRVPGESLADAIGRTPNYQAQSFPQQRYADEDVPAGLVPLESLARRFGIPHEPISRVIDLYRATSGVDARATGRNLAGFSTEYLRWYLLRGTTHARRDGWLRLAS